MSEGRRSPSPSVAEAAEAIDRAELFDGAIRCWQPRRGYRFSVDALLLAMAAFDPPAPDPASLQGRPPPPPETTVLELGTGVGVVLLVLALHPRFRRLVGLELQPPLAALARRNVREAGVADRVSIVEGDLRAPPPAVGAAAFDLVVANPPYYPVGAGLLNPDGQRAVARHELACTLRDVLARARHSLRSTGRALLVYPAERREAVLAAAPEAGLAPSAVRLVRSREGRAPRQVLVELAPIDGERPPRPVRNDPTLDLHDESGTYAGPLADFFRRLSGIAAARDRGE